MPQKEKKQYILGLESSCDESAAAIIEFDKKANFKILSSIISSQVDIHQNTAE
jgi:N6-L-threonylcarbamoyladenine synthase